MKKTNRQSDITSPKLDELEREVEITASNYAQRFKEFGRRAGKFYVICREPKPGHHATPAQWRAWLEWLQSRGAPTHAMSAMGIATVPAQWPEDFDTKCFLSDREFRYPPKETIDIYRRTVMLRRIKELSDRMIPHSRRRRDNRVHETPEQVLGRMVEDFKKSDVSASPTLLAATGWRGDRAPAQRVAPAAREPLIDAGIDAGRPFIDDTLPI